jgi:hypothetical protein
MLAAETLEIGNHLTLSLAKPRYTAETVLTMYGLFLYGDKIHD